MTDTNWIDTLDDTTPRWRLFLLDTKDDGTTEIVCSGLLTERAAMRRAEQAHPSRRAETVTEDRLIEYRKLKPDEPLPSNFRSTSDFGTNVMLWELLARAWDKRLAEEWRT